MSYLEDFSRYRPSSLTPPIGSPNLGGLYIDGIAQSFRSNQFRPPSPRPQQTKSMDGPPLLKRHKVEFSPEEPITHLAAGRNQVTIATKDKKVLVVDTSSSKQSDCDLNRYLGNRLGQAKVHKIFLDPSGKFSLISLAYAADNQPLENLLYVKRIQPLPRLKNHLISAVAWNYPRTTSDSNSNSTGTILLGTTKGLILQTELIHSDETKFFPLSPGPRQYVKEVFDVGPEVGAITGIEYHQIQSSTQTEKSFIIIVSTNNRLYRMVGSVSANIDPPPLHQIFAQNSTNYQDVPGRFNTAKIDFYYPSPNSPPTRFAWLTEPGVMTGEIHNQLSTCKSSFESNDDINIIPYDNSIDSVPLMSSSIPSGMSPPFGSTTPYYYDKPISVVVTNFHVIVLFRYSIKAICILNNATVYEEYYSNKYGNLLGICKDPAKNIIWVFCERAVFRYKISNENKNVWKIYLSQKKFDLAKKYSSSDEKNHDRVICEEAQYYFDSKEYDKSAEIFARSKKPFEDVSTMFMEIKNSKALRKYLMIKLEQFDPIQIIQLTMTLAWLFEIIISSISITQTLPQTDKNADELDELYMELEQLLENKQVVECLSRHSKLFYGIIRNYSDLETFVRVAKLIGDYGDVIQYYIELGEYEKALDIMKSVKKDEFFYKHGHILMKRMPKEMVNALMEQTNIKPAELIAMLIYENPYFNKCSETIRYLEYCVNVLQIDSRVIRNYLFELYARYKSEDTLINYIENESNSEVGQPYYLDLQRCLRLCRELKLVKACVKLYSLMNLYDEALQLALDFDIELAKSIARKVESDDHQKRLWLAIAKNVLTNNLDIQIATGLLKECRLLKIEDILPFFPHYKTIDFFKDAVRQSLQEYRNQIMLLKDGTYDTIADEIRGEIKAFQDRYSIIKVGQKCQICAKNLLSRTFYVFPCGHLFHSDCIIKEIISIDPNYKGIEEKLKQLTIDTSKPSSSSYNRIQNFTINSISSQNTRTSTVVDNKERLVNELDQIISSECVFCGSLLPTYIDKPAPPDLDNLNVDNSY